MAAFTRVTPKRRMPAPLPEAALSAADRAAVHLCASRLLDYPDDTWRSQLPIIRAHVAPLPPEISDLLVSFIDLAERTDPTVWQRSYVETFDLKRRCCLYLTYYAAGDTRRRGAALVTFLEAYRAAGWEFEADELPDFLPAVLEFSARSDSPIASDLLASHREGIEVLRAALQEQSSPWADVVAAVTRSLPPIDEATRDRYLALVNEGPPAEMVGLSFLGNLPPFTPVASREA